ncbi:MAG TPA: hypothetical protein DIW24_08980 [Bacteroidetes bacterium]|nr:hypothetical protein [Bacteroidota bacterium]HRR07758.1 alpha/beta hydrolase-fold protein [Rhodothermales bacterium]
MTEEEILTRHRQHLHGSLKTIRLKSNALRVYKNFYVYEPPYYGHPMYPQDTSLLYLFRGHEREYVNMSEDGSRKMVTTIELLDQLIVAGILPPVIAILPGLNSNNNHVPSLGIDMAGKWERGLKGLGTGKFWEYLTQELFPYVETRWPLNKKGLRLGAGFSLGGYTVSMIAARVPTFFHHVGIYDGTMMWPDQNDPRYPEPEDGVWRSARLFDAALGSPRDAKLMHQWNPTDLILESTGEKLEKLRKITFWVASTPFDGMRGNRERCEYFLQMLQNKSIPVGWKSVPFDPAAEHNWYWNNLFVVRFLKSVFQKMEPIAS